MDISNSQWFSIVILFIEVVGVIQCIKLTYLEYRLMKYIKKMLTPDTITPQNLSTIREEILNKHESYKDLQINCIMPNMGYVTYRYGCEFVSIRYSQRFGYRDNKLRFFK